ncbi:MAG: caspase family protein [Pseudomonadota bacterium]
MAHTPGVAQSNAAPGGGSAIGAPPSAPTPVTAPVGRQAEVDSEIAVIMQMLRDEGIDIDDRMARARIACRNKVMSQAGDSLPEDIERAVEKCSVTEEGIVYARAINEMNATRATEFDNAMAQYNAEVAEVERQKREFERKQREYELSMQSHNTEVAEIERQQRQYEIDKAAHEKLLAGLPKSVRAKVAASTATRSVTPAPKPVQQAAVRKPTAESAPVQPAANETSAPALARADPPGAAAPVQTAPVQVASAQPAPMRPAPTQTAPLRTAPVQTPPVQTPSVQTQPAKIAEAPPARQQVVPPRSAPQITTQEPNNPALAASTPSTAQRTETAPALTRGPPSGITRGRMLSPGNGPTAQEEIELAIMKASGPRIALVIGNEDYAGSMGSLANPVNDAVLIGATLRSLGFDVEIVTDGSQREMKEAVQRLGDRLAAAGDNATGLFYYAGHGVQSQGNNFLIPVGSVVDSESDLELEAVKADAVLAQMEEAYVSTRIVILDACRNMPLRRRTRNGARGLARMEIPNGSFVAYSTSPGSTADDGGRNIHSPFAEALATQMLVPDRPIEVTFREVRKQVVEVTSGDQVPWDSSSLLDTFSFFATR